MKSKPQIEATLERSLRKQVNVPRLDGKFDAGVWARIEAEESRAASSSAPATLAVPKAARWLRIFNFVGLAGVVLFITAYGVQMLAGVDLSVAQPEISAAALERIVSGTSMGIAAAAIIVGLMYSPLGRRLREELG